MPGVWLGGQQLKGGSRVWQVGQNLMVHGVGEYVGWMDGCVWGISYRGGGMGNKSWDKVELEGVMRCGRLQGGVPH